MRCSSTTLGQHPSVRAAATDGSLDQRLFYQHPDCAEHWESIITAQQYPTFNKCKFSLDKLWANEISREEIVSITPSRVVMLGGGGAFSKDVALISAMIELGTYCPDSPLNYTLLDVSTPMLRRSRLRLGLNWRNTDWGCRVGIELIAGDFMYLHRKQRRERLRRGGGRLLWALTGGTIGNVSEGRFFSSLNRVAVSGDILVLSASVLCNGKAVLESDHDDTDRYLSPAVKALLRSPVQDLMSHLKSKSSVDRILSGLKPKFQEGHIMGITDVPKGHTLVMTAKVGDDSYDVFNHTHYDPESLKSFAKFNGWAFLDQVSPGYGEPDFAQFLFKRE